MPSFTLKDPTNAQGSAPGEEQPDPEDPFARHARLLCEGKLMKALNKAKIPEPDRYRIYSEVAKKVAQTENEINSDLPAYTARWRKVYTDPASVVFQPTGILFPLRVLMSTTNEAFKYESLHRLNPRVGDGYLLHLLGIKTLELVLGILTFAGALPCVLFSIILLVGEPQSWISIWHIVGLGLLAVAAGYAFHNVQRLTVPKPLRMYAGGTFELVSLKRVKTPTIPPLL